jgi:type II secretory pathway component GspD/PulD (secretin)
MLARRRPIADPYSLSRQLAFNKMRALLSILLVASLVLPFAVAGTADTGSPVCTPSGKKCTATVALSSATVADVKLLLGNMLPSVIVQNVSNPKAVALIGTNGAVTAALKMIANLDTASSSGSDTTAKVDRICTIDNVSPAAASSVADGVNKFLNGSGPSPAASGGAKLDFSASTGSVIVDSSQRRIFVHAPQSSINNLRLLLRTFTNESYSKQTYEAYQVRYAVPDPIPAPTGSPATGAVSSVAGQTVGNSSVQDLATAVSAIINQSGAPDVQLIADRSYPSILVSGSEHGVEHALALLRQLDRRPPVIDFEAKVYSINQSTADALGLSFPQSISGSIGVYEAPLAGATTATPGPVAAGKIVATAGPNIAVALNTLLQDGAARVIAMPRVSTVNGRMAIIDVGQVIPFAATGTTSAGTIAANVFNYVIGTHLEMIPMVNYDNSISVYVHPINSTFTGFTNQNAPQFDRREMSASYRLKNDEAVYLSGLEETDDSDTKNQVPILNLIPFFGKHLFGSHSYNQIVTHLTIEIKAKLIDGGDYQYDGAAQADLSTPQPAPKLTPEPLTLKCTWSGSTSTAKKKQGAAPAQGLDLQQLDATVPNLIAPGTSVGPSPSPFPVPTFSQPPPPPPPALQELKR